MSQKVKKLLKQLKDEELHELMKEKKLKVPEKWSRRTLIDFLSYNVSEKDIESILKRREKEISPQLKGSILEKRVMEIFSKQGYTVESNTKIKGFAEFDIIGWKDVGVLIKKRQWVFIECKNKSKVIPEDWKKFIGNFMTFKKNKQISDEDVTAYLITTGLFHPEVTKESKKYPNIKLKRIRI